VNIDILRRTPGPLTKPIGAGGTTAFIAGGLLVMWLSYIHFHLWQSLGYRRIPTIGPLFLIQSVSGLLLGLTTVTVRRVWTALLGAGFVVATLLGFIFSVEVGLFGFTDSWSAPEAHLAFGLELVSLGVFALAGALCVVGGSSKKAVPALSPRRAERTRGAGLSQSGTP